MSNLSTQDYKEKRKQIEDLELAILGTLDQEKATTEIAFQAVSLALQTILRKVTSEEKYSPKYHNELIEKLLKFRATGRKSNSDYVRFEGEVIERHVEKIWGV